MILATFLNASALGDYTAGGSIRTALLVPFQAYGLGLFNDLMDEKKAGRSAYSYTMRATARWFVVMLIAGLAVFAFAPYLIPVLFGPEFAFAVVVVRIVAFAPAFECVSAQVMQWLFAENLPSVVSRVHMLGAVFSATSIVIGASGWGVVGAACAVTLAALFLAVCTLFVAMKTQARASAQHGNDLRRDDGLPAVGRANAWDNSR
jgi:O-antigen/teichoic acid export membrane protein